jgi:hypothetical protein
VQADAMQKIVNNKKRIKIEMSAAIPTQGFSANNVSGAGIFMIACLIISIALFINSNIQTSNLIGGTENWRAIKPQINRIWLQTTIGAIILFIGMVIYVLQYEKSSVMFILLISCISLALSFASISMSAISTSGAAPSS